MYFVFPIVYTDDSELSFSHCVARTLRASPSSYGEALFYC
uniref:Uncharacterized protein n=1 Tax=Myoviridae sp. ct31P9 TaxID=2827657 RepID=A0A8S5T3A2_9CAUD|nr:MAG TPA: hypothetical protein [Caudoviricetes sp.]DAF57737.1 MAG TPA: hypothetical protein [Myoviridae sp. ct31P9]